MMNLQETDNSSRSELERQQNLIRSNEVVTQILDGMNIYVLILNKKREIIYINREFGEALNLTETDALGHRPGDLLKCKIAGVSGHGCGMSEECSMCRAKNLVVETIHSGVNSEGQVSILSLINGLEITSTFGEKVTSIKIDTDEFYMVAFIDKSSEMERNNLEYIFYHDILNSASSLYNIIRFIKMGNGKFADDEEIEMIEGYIQNIIDEIQYHRSISFAESDNLSISFEEVEINDLVSQVVKMLNKDGRFHHIKVECQLDWKLHSIKTDRLILKRIFTNLLKNALEANEKHSVIYVKVEEVEEKVQIIFHNEEVIPMEYQGEIFLKGYSSKSKSRGYGVYGSKLLLMKYLNGDLRFTSKGETGTDFIVSLPKKVID